MRLLPALLLIAACAGPAPAGDDAGDDADGEGVDAAPAPTGDRITCPMPLRSQARAPVASRGDARGLVDGDLWGPHWAGDAGDWVAIDVGAGPEQVMTAWTASDLHEPRAYALETSADSTTGRDGTWTPAVAVADNRARTRADVVRFAGQRWLRLRLVAGAADLLELAVHDASRGTCDSWIFIGDSISAMAFNLSTAFSDDVHAARPDTYPLRLAIGAGGTNSEVGLEHLDEWLATYPDVTNWVVSYGTNDMGGGNPIHAPAFGDRMIELVTRLRAAGKRVFVPQIPYGKWTGAADVIPVYNAQIDRVVRDAGALPGPDLYAHFRAHPDELGDDIHPSDVGGRSMNRLWADIALGLYP